MNFINPSVEVLFVNPEALRLIELAGRTCYKSEDKITEDSNIDFAKMILKLGHESVIEHVSATIKFVCDRGVTHEIVRHRLASYSQESTRYCNYGKLGINFIVPCDFELDEDDLELLKSIETHYNKCLEKGRKPQQARYFLPNGLKTEIVMTCNLREWAHFFTLRTSKAAHPQMVEVATIALEEMKKRIPIIFDSL